MTGPALPPLIELFSGTGGFSLGAHKAGFRVAAAFDNDPVLTSSYRRNFPDTQFFLEDVSSLTAAALRESVGGSRFGLFGGPPCQGFSDIGKRDPNDPRRDLLVHFFRLVSEARPVFFVMENVRGLGNADSIEVLESAMGLVSDRYALHGPVILDASDFGAATKRPRLFVIGVHRDFGDAVTAEDIESQKRPSKTVRDAIADLVGAERVEDCGGFDVWEVPEVVARSEYASSLSRLDRRFTGHLRTRHTSAVVDRFKALSQGELDKVGRHPRLAWSGLCPTLRAGTGADRGSYQSVRPIHPEEPRVITVREAARLQGFPDAHLFHPTIWHSFRMIGNSVSPLMSEAIFRAVASKLQDYAEAS
ncbi:DNA cytosine methyltransferase [Guyparkeria sp. SB14A]|uniref:DNA cytosine methyltransferase n=1 Tax=Guyparkeria hydrothermalis TaxID=923 RepID=UPI0010AC916B|nr:DNA cytosine methyltransferase [Guyparkeria sp. SB14A]